jgi:flagellar biosynthesis protein FlhB
VVTGVALFMSAQGIDTGSAMGQGGDFMPKLLTTIWLIFSALIFITGLREKGKGAEGMDVKGFIATLVLLFAYIFLIDIIGFTITSIVYVFIQMLLFAPKDNRTKKTYIVFAAISIIAPIVVNLIFANVFFLILPEGMLFRF